MPESIGRVKACTECRQQKVKCDAFKDYSRPCSRCRAAGLPCVFSKDFQRRPRQTKAQLQYELDRLKAQGEPSKNQYAGQSATQSPTTDVGRSIPPSPHKMQSPSSHSDSTYSRSGPSLRELLRRSSSGGKSTPAVDSAQSLSEPSDRGEGTLARTLKNITVDSGKINDCYASFLGNYAFYTHGLVEMVVSPNERYKQSPLLFWAIICVGSRGYQKDSTLYERLAEPVIDLMFASFIRPKSALPVLQAAIILCRWPFPVDLTYRESSQAIAGAALSLALQNGLHMYSREQDFVVRSSTTKPSVYEPPGISTIRDEVATFRTRIWAYCVVTFQHVNLGDGLPPLSVVPYFRESESWGSIYKLLPERLAYELRLYRIQNDATNLVCSSSDVYGSKPDQTLNAMITLYDDNVQSISLPQENVQYRFLRSCTRVSIMGLIYVTQNELDHVHALRLYKIAQETVQLAFELEREKPSSTFYIPQFYVRMVLAAVHIMIRICKSPLGRMFDLQEAQNTIFNAVGIFLRRKTTPGEIMSRQAEMIPQLWGSKKAFVWDEKGQNGLRVRARYRLVTTPIFDNVWWWRREFGKDSDDSQVPSFPMASYPQDVVSRQVETDCTDTNRGGMIGHQNSMPPPTTSQVTTAAPAQSQALLPAVDLDMPMAVGDGFWTQSMDAIFADFMQWWDVSNLQPDMGTLNDYALPDGSPLNVLPMEPANFNPHPQRLM